MLIRVKVYPSSKKQEIIQKSKNSFEIKIKQKPIMGLANKAVVRLFSSHFNIPESRIKLIKGFKQRAKIIEIK